LPNETFEFWMKTKLQSDGTVMPRSSAAIGCAVATFDFVPQPKYSKGLYIDKV
jgi:hypothetical protein